MKDRLIVHLDQHEKDILYPATDKFSGNLEDLDISLLYKIIRNLNTITPPGNGWGNRPDLNDSSIGACIERIRIAKNSIVSHHGDCRIPDKEFGVKWKELKQNIVFLSNGLFDSEIDTLLSSPIDEAMEENFISTIKEKAETNKIKDEYTCGKCNGTSTSLVEFYLPVNVHNEGSSATDKNHLLLMHLECEGISLTEVNEKRHLIECNGMQIAKAEEGSIILWLVICSSLFTTSEAFYEETEEFLEKFFDCFPLAGACENVDLQMKLVNTGCYYKGDVYLCGECSEEFDTFSTYIVHKKNQHIQMSKRRIKENETMARVMPHITEDKSYINQMNDSWITEEMNERRQYYSDSTDKTEEKTKENILKLPVQTYRHRDTLERRSRKTNTDKTQLPLNCRKSVEVKDSLLSNYNTSTKDKIEARRWPEQQIMNDLLDYYTTRETFKLAKVEENLQRIQIKKLREKRPTQGRMKILEIGIMIMSILGGIMIMPILAGIMITQRLEKTIMLIHFKGYGYSNELVLFLFIHCLMMLGVCVCLLRICCLCRQRRKQV